MRVDTQVDKLINRVSDISKELTRLLSLLPFLEDSQEREQVQGDIRDLLREVDTEVRDWSDSELQDAADNHEELLLGMVPELSGLSSSASEGIVSKISGELKQEARKATRSILVYAATLASTSSRAVSKALDRTSTLRLSRLDDGGAPPHTSQTQVFSRPTLC
jgi:hypothetical protein